MRVSLIGPSKQNQRSAEIILSDEIVLGYRQSVRPEIITACPVTQLAVCGKTQCHYQTGDGHEAGSLTQPPLYGEVRGSECDHDEDPYQGNVGIAVGHRLVANLN